MEGIELDEEALTTLFSRSLVEHLLNRFLFQKNVYTV
jgi:hypothetical protein